MGLERDSVAEQVPSLAPITGYQAFFLCIFCEFADLWGLERDSEAEQVSSLSHKKTELLTLL